MKHVVKALFYLLLLLFTLNRIQIFHKYLIQYRREYLSDVYAYNEICRNIVKISDMGSNADFCKNIDIRISQGPYIRAFERLYVDSTHYDIGNLIGPIINNSNFLIFFSLLCIFLYVISKFVPFFGYFFKTEDQNSYKLVNYSYNFENPIAYSGYNPLGNPLGNPNRTLILQGEGGFIPAVQPSVQRQKLKYT